MPKALIGIVYYDDDPHQRVFRRIYPTLDDRELDQPPTDGAGAVLLDVNGKPHSWVSFGVDPSRPTVMKKVAASDDMPRLQGTPFTPASEPVIYYLNLPLIADTLVVDPLVDAPSNILKDKLGVDDQLATLSSKEQLDVFVMSTDLTWMNVIDLGAGIPSILAKGIISPAWIVVVGGGDPGIGTQQKSTTIGGQPVALWTV